MACLGLVEQAPSEHSRRLAAIIHRADKCKDASPWLASRWPLVVRQRLCTIHDVNVSASTSKGHTRALSFPVGIGEGEW